MSILKIATQLAAEKANYLTNIIEDAQRNIGRQDFIWEALLTSFGTMGNSRGLEDIRLPVNSERLKYGAIATLLPENRLRHIQDVLDNAPKVRYRNRKATYMANCFNFIEQNGGTIAVKNVLLNLNGRDAKIEYLRRFNGIGPKYARNMMMDAYHPDFHDSIAIDSRIMKISTFWNVEQDIINNYKLHENYYLAIARNAGLNGWKLDRLMYNFTDRFLQYP